MWVNVQFALNKNCALEVYGVFVVYHLGFSSKQFQSCNKSLINQACSVPSWENIGPWSFLHGPHCTRSVLSRPRVDILPVRPSCLVNKIYILKDISHSTLSCLKVMATYKMTLSWRKPKNSNLLRSKNIKGIIITCKGTRMGTDGED